MLKSFQGTKLRVDSAVFQEWNEASNQWEITYKEEYTCDANGERIQRFSYKNMMRRFVRSATYLNPDIFIRAVVPINFGYRTKLSAYGAFELGEKFKSAEG